MARTPSKDRHCTQCGDHIPTWVKVDGKSRNLRWRRRCLKCLPFGNPRGRWQGVTTSAPLTRAANARKLSKEAYDTKRKEMGCCPVTLMRKNRRARIVALVGGTCQLCCYARYSGGLAFHHEAGEDKTAEISRLFMARLSTLLKEVRKCALICHCCHTEAHAGLISPKRIHTAVLQTQVALRNITAESWADLSPECGSWRSLEVR